jgi:hypothetical protein
MGSATNAWGISPEEYSKFAMDVYKYLSYIKGLDKPSFEEIEEMGKPVEIDNADTSSKSDTHFCIKK